MLGVRGAFLAELEDRGVDVSRRRRKGSDLIFLGVEQSDGRRSQTHTALRFVIPKARR